MANTLFPVFEVPSALAGSSGAASAKYKKAPLWDFETGDFVTDETGAVLYGSGYESWVLWCKKSILTQRGAYLAYSGSLGTELEEAFREPDRAAIESSFERTISEALLADPLGRTAQVSSFEFTWNSSSLLIQCTVFGTDGSSAELKTEIDQ